jgi:hypothetical protein
MKLDLKGLIYEADGSVAIKQITDKKNLDFINKNGFEKVIDNRDFIVRDVMVIILNSNSTGKPYTTEEQSRRNEIMTMLFSGKKKIELNAKQIVLLQDASVNLSNTVTITQIDAILNGKENPLKGYAEIEEIEETQTPDPTKDLGES